MTNICFAVLSFAAIFRIAFGTEIVFSPKLAPFVQLSFNSLATTTQIYRMVLSPDEKFLFAVGRTTDRLGRLSTNYDLLAKPFIYQISTETGNITWTTLDLSQSGSYADVLLVGTASNYSVYAVGERIEAGIYKTVVDQVDLFTGDVTRKFTKAYDTDLLVVSSAIIDKLHTIYISLVSFSSGGGGDGTVSLLPITPDWAEGTSVTILESARSRFKLRYDSNRNNLFASGTISKDSLSYFAVALISLNPPINSPLVLEKQLTADNSFFYADSFIDNSGSLITYLYVADGFDGKSGNPTKLFMYKLTVKPDMTTQTDLALFGNSQSNFAKPLSSFYNREQNIAYLAFSVKASNGDDKVIISKIDYESKLTTAVAQFPFVGIGSILDLIIGTNEMSYGRLTVMNSLLAFDHDFQSGLYVVGMKLIPKQRTTVAPPTTPAYINTNVNGGVRTGANIKPQGSKAASETNPLAVVGGVIGGIFLLLMVGIYACFRYRDKKIADYNKKLQEEADEKKRKKEEARVKRRKDREERKKKEAIMAVQNEYDGVTRNPPLLGPPAYAQVVSDDESGFDSPTNVPTRIGTESSAATNRFSMMGTGARTIVSSERELALPGFLFIQSVNDFKLVQVLAQGGYSTVHLAEPESGDLKAKTSGEKLVVKMFKSELTNRTEIEGFNQEVSLMHFFRDESQFVKLIGYGQQPFFIAMKHYPLGSFADMIHTNTTETWSARLVTAIMKDLTGALSLMHQNDFVHCDVKVLLRFISLTFL
jgi:hypothetical protein